MHFALPPSGRLIRILGPIVLPPTALVAAHKLEIAGEAAGRYHFSSTEARKALGVSAAATKLALGRLARQKLVASRAFSDSRPVSPSSYDRAA
jgi:hypothetical protein